MNLTSWQYQLLVSNPCIRGKKTHKHLNKHLSSSFLSLNLTQSPILCLPKPMLLTVSNLAWAPHGRSPSAASHLLWATPGRSPSAMAGSASSRRSPQPFFPPRASLHASPYVFPHKSRLFLDRSAGGAVQPSDRRRFWPTAGGSCQAAAAWNGPRPVPGSWWSPHRQALLQPPATEAPPFVPSTGRNQSYLCNYQPGNVWLGVVEDAEVGFRWQFEY